MLGQEAFSVAIQIFENTIIDMLVRGESTHRSGAIVISAWGVKRLLAP
jgi:hypothetical protein